MKITDVRAVPVRMPVTEAPYQGRSYTQFQPDRTGRRSPKRPDPMLEYVLVYIESDAGLTGIGESQADIGFLGSAVHLQPPGGRRTARSSHTQPLGHRKLAALDTRRRLSRGPVAQAEGHRARESRGGAAHRPEPTQEREEPEAQHRRQAAGRRLG